MLSVIAELNMHGFKTIMLHIYGQNVCFHIYITTHDCDNITFNMQ